MVAIERNKELRNNSPIPDIGGNKTRITVTKTSKIKIKVIIIAVVKTSRLLCGIETNRFIIISRYSPSQD